MSPTDNSLTSVVDGTLLSWLPNLGLAHSTMARQLNRLPATDPLAVAWRTYVLADRAWIFERKAGDGGLSGGMSVMLCIPRQPAGIQGVAAGDIDWLDHIDAFGVPLLAEGVTSPTIHCLNATKYPEGSAQFSKRPDLLMGLPMMLPAWSIYPPKGYSHGWRTLESLPDTQEDTLCKWIAQLSAPRLSRFKAALLPLANPNQRVPGSTLGNFFSALSALEELLARAMVKRFVSHLNPVVVAECLSKHLALYPEAYNWVVGASTAQAREWRMDALEVFPAVSVTAVFPCSASYRHESVKTSRTMQKSSRTDQTAPISGTVEFSRVVDTGLPLIKGLAKSLGVRPVAIKALRGVTNRSVELFREPPLGWVDIVLTLDIIPPERYPKYVWDWWSFSALYMECVRLHRAMSVLHSTLARKFMEETARPWLATRAKNWLNSSVRWTDGMRGLDNLQDAVEVAAELQGLVAELGLSASERYKAYAVFSKMAPEDWRRHIRTLGRSEELNTLQWDSVMHSGSIDGVRVRALNSNAALFEEGVLMRHCIYTYRERLQRDQLLVFAIGDDKTDDRSTVLLRYQQAKASLWMVSIVAQHAAFNRSPSPLSQTVAKSLCEELSSGHYADALTVANHYRVRRYPPARSTSSSVRAVHIDADDTPALRRIDSENRAKLRSNLLALITASSA